MISGKVIKIVTVHVSECVLLCSSSVEMVLIRNKFLSH